MKKTVLITGGSAGIGYEMSRLFARDNYRLLWVSKPPEELANAKEKIMKELPSVEVRILAKDLSNVSAAQEVFDWVESLGFFVDVLVNNAGFGNYGDFEKNDLEKDLAMIRLNVINVYQLTRLFLVEMEKNKGGKIMNISSSASYFPLPNSSAYAATKAFVRHMSNSLWLELKARKSKVQITTVCPGAIVNTNFQAAANMQNVRTFTSGLASVTPQEVAKDAYKGLKKGKQIVRTGWKFRINYYITKITPRFITDFMLIREMEREE